MKNDIFPSHGHISCNACFKDKTASEMDIGDWHVVNKRGIRARFNLVRYNPAAPKYGCEPEEQKQEALFERMSNGLTGGGRGKIVPRVGPDVYASCGMFVP